MTARGSVNKTVVYSERILLALAMMLPGCGRGTSKPTSVANTKPAEKSAASHDNPTSQRTAAQIAEPASPTARMSEVEQRSQSFSSEAAAKPQPIHRPDDRRSQHDEKRLAEAGVRLYESKRLKLYTDIDPEVARTLPQIVDEVYRDWVGYFGELPPDRTGSEFQMTGYLIKDESLFREMNLVPEDLPMFEHGRHRRNEFWMREQKYDYFRRHLLVHEATHCFMTFMPGVDAPVWYLEGMAEYFATHRIEPDGSIQFRVMPSSPEDFAGWGRITGIRTESADGKAKSIHDLLVMQSKEFLTPEPYAWSWALCQFLDAHPRYRERFRTLGGHTQRNAFPREFAAAFGGDERDLATEWTLFTVNLRYGYEAARAAINFQPGKPLSVEQSHHQIDLATDRGWQSSGVLVEASETYEVIATGRFTLADQPKPWVSEPQGISFRYFDGHPLGQLLGCLRTESGDAGGESEAMLNVIAIGGERSFKAPVTGTLYLRLNDAWNSLHDNRGQVSVEVRRVASGL